MNSDAPDDVDLEEQADAVADFVEELLGQMDIDAIAEPAQQGERFYVDILEGPPDDLALLIGKHGQTLDAIQELARNVVGLLVLERTAEREDVLAPVVRAGVVVAGFGIQETTGALLTNPPFLDEVIVRFGVADPEGDIAQQLPAVG